MIDPGAATTAEGRRPRLSVVVPVLDGRDEVGLLSAQILPATLPAAARAGTGEGLTPLVSRVPPPRRRGNDPGDSNR